MSNTRSKAVSLSIVTGAYVVAIAVAAAWLVWGPSTGRLWLDTFIADVLATLVVFAFSRAYRNSSFYDAYWSVIPPLLLFYWWSQGGPGVDQLRCWLVAIVVRAVGDTPDRQLGLRLPRPASRGLALPDVQGTRGPLGVLRRPVRDPSHPDAAGVPRHAAGVRRGHPARHRSGVAGLAWRSSIGVGRGRPSSWSPTSRCTASSRTAGRARPWTAGCGRGRGTRTTSASSASGSRWRCSALRRRPSDAWWLFVGRGR